MVVNLTKDITLFFTAVISFERNYKKCKMCVEAVIIHMLNFIDHKYSTQNAVVLDISYITEWHRD